MAKKVHGKLNERIDIDDAISKGRVPYRNRWGHWVWRKPDIRDILSMGMPIVYAHENTWPGMKPPTKTCTPVLEEDGWYWREKG
jgi:hypothetical protein